MKEPSLRVVANPYASLDADGDPTCHVTRVDARDRLVGATLNLTRSRAAGKPKFDFSADPVELPDLHPFRAAIRSAELFAADEATAKRAGVPFVSPTEALASAKSRAAAAYRDLTGEDAPFLSPPPAPSASASPAPKGEGASK